MLSNADSFTRLRKKKLTLNNYLEVQIVAFCKGVYGDHH